MSTLAKLLRRLVFLVVGATVIIAVYLFSMRFADGPSAIVAGGPFSTGEYYNGAEPNWAWLADREEVEFQLLAPPRSRTTWILEHDGRIYIPCGYMDTPWGKIWKQWPIEAQADGRAILRVDGILYYRQLVRIKQGPQIPHLLSELARKYFAQPDMQSPSAAARDQLLIAGLQQVTNESLWLFELAPRN